MVSMMAKDWLIVHYFITGESERVGYFSKQDAICIMSHFTQYCCDLGAIHNGISYHIENGKLKKDDGYN